MLEKSFGIFFFLKKPKTENADGIRYVYLRMTVDGISKEVSTKRLWHPAKWNAAAGKATGTKGILNRSITFLNHSRPLFIRPNKN